MFHSSQLHNNSVRIDFSYNDIDMQISDPKSIEYKLKPIVVNKLTAIHKYLFSLLNEKHREILSQNPRLKSKLVIGEILYYVSVMLSDDTICSTHIRSRFESSVPIESIIDHIKYLIPHSKKLVCSIFMESFDLTINRSMPINMKRVESILSELEMLDKIKVSDVKKVDAMRKIPTLPLSETVLPDVYAQINSASSISLQAITPTTSANSLSSNSVSSDLRKPHKPGSRRVDSDNPLSLQAITPSQSSKPVQPQRPNLFRESSGNPPSLRAFIPITRQGHPTEQTPSANVYMPNLEQVNGYRNSEVRTVHNTPSTGLPFFRSRHNQTDILSRAGVSPQ